MSSKVVAILGGTFDPVHCDHIRMAGECINHSVADEVWFVPSPDDRWDKKPQLQSEHRLAMLHLGVDGFNCFKVSDIEIKSGAFRGSYVLLSRLKEMYPEYEFRLIVGSDTYPSIPLWRDVTLFTGSNYNGEQLLKEFALILFNRDTTPMPDPIEHTAKGYTAFFEVKTTCVGSLSSTEIRKRGANCCGLVPEQVRKYIEVNKLYTL